MIISRIQSFIATAHRWEREVEVMWPDVQAGIECKDSVHMAMYGPKGGLCGYARMTIEEAWLLSDILAKVVEDAMADA